VRQAFACGGLQPARRVALLAFALCVSAEPRFEITGRVAPPAKASISLRGALSPFSKSTLADSQGSFRIGDLEPGSYTLHVFAPGLGETQRTVSVGPGSADDRGRVSIDISLEGPAVLPDRSGMVSARELAIPDAARREYERAEKALARRDVQRAALHLEKAVEIEPRYCAAWNHLGTIAYQTGRYQEAEKHFRRALASDPDAYAPLVNLGGVLINLERAGEALSYNLHAVLKRPSDALANSQLGMTYALLGKSELAEKHLREAIRLDPAHFSEPQLFLAEISARRGDREQAVHWLESLLEARPDSPHTPAIKARIAVLSR
jgi:Tfp pilus assembly protein PilF